MYIRDVAASAGLTPQAIRFYEQLGLIEKPHRTSGGYRLYSAETVERIRFIKDAQRLGFGLDEIREVLRLKYSGQSPCECVRRMLSRKLKESRDKIRQMDQMQREFSACLQASRKRARPRRRLDLSDRPRRSSSTIHGQRTNDPPRWN